MRRNVENHRKAKHAGSGLSKNPSQAKFEKSEDGTMYRSNSKPVLVTADSQPAVDAKKVTIASFTEADKRNVIHKFMQNPEVMFLIYGLMFPSQTLAAANKQMNQELL